MHGRLDLEEILNHVFEAVCSMMLAESSWIEDITGRRIPSTESFGIGAIEEAKVNWTGPEGRK